jgi:hypothetical protein
MVSIVFYFQRAQNLENPTTWWVTATCAARDLLGTGTLSDPAPEQDGSLLELTKGEQEVLKLDNGEIRMLLEDGDTVFFVDTVNTLVRNASVLGSAMPRYCPHAQKVFYEKAKSITTRATVGKPARVAL